MEGITKRKDILLAFLFAVVVHVVAAYTQVSAHYPSVRIAQDRKQFLELSFVTTTNEAVKKKNAVRPVVEPKPKREVARREKIIERNTDIKQKPVEKKNSVDQENTKTPEMVEDQPVRKAITTSSLVSESAMTATRPAVVTAVPRYEENAPPPYPRIARRRGYEGVVLLSVHVLPDGTVADLKIKKTSGHSVLDRAARKAVQRWKFRPATTMGLPVTMWVDVPVHFVLQEKDEG